MQPTFNPWIGYFDLIDYVDKFVFLDTVQLNQQSWQTRNKIKVQQKELLFSLPIQKNRSKIDLSIKDALLDFRKFDFRKKLLKTLQQNYTKAKYYDEVHQFIEEIVLYNTEYLSTYTINIITQISEKLHFTTEILRLSQTEYQQHESKGNLVLNICQYFGAKNYISPLGAKVYLEKLSNNFTDEGINIIYQHYNPVTYHQLGENFIPYLGIFDLLYNEGFENSSTIIKSGRRYENR